MKSLTFTEFETNVANAEVAVVKYWADWCVDCHKAAPVIDAVVEKTTVPFYSVNVDDVPELKEKARIKAIPALLFYKNGRVREFIFGVPTEEKIQQKLRMIQR